MLRFVSFGAFWKFYFQFWTILLIRSYTSVGLVLFCAAIFFRVRFSAASIPCFFIWLIQQGSLFSPIPKKAHNFQKTLISKKILSELVLNYWPLIHCFSFYSWTGGSRPKFLSIFVKHSFIVNIIGSGTNPLFKTLTKPSLDFSNWPEW